MTPRFLPVALALLAAACGPAPVVLDVKLATDVCGVTGLNPLDGVTELRIWIYGAGLAPTPIRVARTKGGAELAAFEPGTDRHLVIEGLRGDEVVSRGATGPMDLLELEGTVPVSVTLRRLGAFTPAALADGACSVLATARAGHTSTLLDDGRVLIAGGYALEGGTKKYLDSTELYDPRSGKFLPGPKLQIRRAFHTATMQPRTGLVIIAGGEFETDSGRAIKLAEVFDPVSNTFHSVRMQVGRVRHAAAASSVAGRVVLIGGQDSSGLPLKSMEMFEPAVDAFVPLRDDLPAPRIGPSAATLLNGSILVAGGWDGSRLLKRAEVLVPARDGSYTLATEVNLSFNVERSQPLLASLDAFRVLAVGGFATGNLTSPLGDSVDDVELAELDTRTVSITTNALRARRGDATATELSNGTVLVAGGAAQTNGQLAAFATADVIAPADGTGAAGVTVTATPKLMRDGRWQAAATRLQDGTVLVTGGLTLDSQGRTAALRAVEVFQPGYHASPLGPYR